MQIVLIKISKSSKDKRSLLAKIFEISLPFGEDRMSYLPGRKETEGEAYNPTTIRSPLFLKIIVCVLEPRSGLF
jgi:hypothetical protein